MSQIRDGKRGRIDYLVKRLPRADTQVGPYGHLRKNS